MPQFSCFTPHFFDLTWSIFEVRCIIFDIPMVIFLVLTHTFLNTINQISFFHFFIFWLRRRCSRSAKFKQVWLLRSLNRIFHSPAKRFFSHRKHENSRKERLARRERMIETNVNNCHNSVHKLLFLYTDGTDFWYKLFYSNQTTFSKKALEMFGG